MQPRPVGEEVDVDHAVVLEVPAGRQLLPHRDPERLELIRRADAREHQQHRRLVGARGDDHLALGADGLADAVADDLDTDRAVVVEHDPLDEDARRHLQVGPFLRRVEERVGSAAAQAVALGELEAGHALGPVDVQVVDQLVPRLHGGLELRVDQGAHGAAVGDGERAADPVELVLAPLVVLRPLEVREHLVVAPPRRSAGRPAVVVEPVAA